MDPYFSVNNKENIPNYNVISIYYIKNGITNYKEIMRNVQQNNENILYPKRFWLRNDIKILNFSFIHSF